MNFVEKGFSLVELLVALVLGLVLITGVAHLFLATNKTWALQDELSRIQENARMAMDILGTEIRTASYTGCPAQADLANNLSSGHDLRDWMAHFDKGILGFSSGADTTGRIDSNAISGAIVVHNIDREQGITVSSHDVSTATATLSVNHNHDEGDLLAFVSNDCEQISVFRAGGDTELNQVTHPASNGTLGNCISHLNGNFNCHTNSAVASSMSHRGAQLAPLNSYAFYLREANDVPTLYRKQAGEYTSGNSINAEALVEGIERMNILYGVDTDNDGITNRYQTADDVGLFADSWRNVISVKLELLARSFTEIAPEPQSYFFAGQRIDPTDNFLRRSFVSTIQLRNRLE